MTNKKAVAAPGTATTPTAPAPPTSPDGVKGAATPDAQPCPIAASLAILGSKWTLLIIRDIVRGLRRFNDLEHSLGCSRALLSARLSQLRDAGIIETAAYREPRQREREQYTLTDKGLDLLPILGALQDWGNRYASPDAAPTVAARHRGCGAKVATRLVCAAGHTLTAQDIDIDRS